MISDLHLGDGGVRDNFEAGKKTPPLRAFLDHVGAEGGELFILGDLFELWQMSMSRLFVKRREVLDHLATLPLVYVPGNHDVDLVHFIGTDFIAHPFFGHMHAPFGRELGGKRFRFFHGHEVDPFNAGDDPGFGRILAIFGGIFEDQNGSPLLASGEAAEDVLEQFGDSMLTLWKLAMATMAPRRRGEDMVAGLVLLLLPASAALLKLALSGALCYYGAGELLAGIFGRRRQRPRRTTLPAPTFSAAAVTSGFAKPA